MRVFGKIVTGVAGTFVGLVVLGALVGSPFSGPHAAVAAAYTPDMVGGNITFSASGGHDSICAPEFSIYNSTGHTIEALRVRFKLVSEYGSAGSGSFFADLIGPNESHNATGWISDPPGACQSYMHATITIVQVECRFYGGDSGDCGPLLSIPPGEVPSYRYKVTYEPITR